MTKILNQTSDENGSMEAKSRTMRIRHCWYVRLQRKPASAGRTAAFGGLGEWQVWADSEVGPSYQISTASEIARATSSSTPRYRTVLSILVWPSKSCTARRLPVFL